MNTNKKRLTILTQPEIQDYFGLPRFTLAEREYYFTLSDTEYQVTPQGWSVNSRVNFILMGVISPPAGTDPICTRP
ncbi:hypothetical protein XNC1_p0128 (plasmid) [Xenorhabdus nematophila ATCC 19061]|uniref:Uncharacterized protein n=1 Tax=Xenorhabdus nematophila (strain ATCC 19061 / DSM 3370 / CCUG 14189 / LMG 1036 / NCIMB 9965 / AN6) TaxID=406817 RepID=D3VM44_XENNA|nr:hypothetical protein XNC1_p0128 [Xenorhabdus nematophila ATCC 19061]CEK25616.1 conserved protein of unknown function [Xenorhabdus nematophila AN6/1]